MLEVVRDLLVGALGIADETAELLLELGIVIDLEMRRPIDLPPMLVVLDFVLAVERREGLAEGHYRRCQERNDNERRSSHDSVMAFPHRLPRIVISSRSYRFSVARRRKAQRRKKPGAREAQCSPVVVTRM